MRSKPSSEFLASYSRNANTNFLQAIESEEQYESMLNEIDELAARSNRNAVEDKYLETLSILVEEYEGRIHAIDVGCVSPLEVLKDLLDEQGMTGSDLGRLLGQRELGSKILLGKRQMSKAHIEILSKRFKVSPSLFF
jgi:HTH-type transcriptional regulator/antitoxin HigA